MKKIMIEIEEEDFNVLKEQAEKVKLPAKTLSKLILQSVIKESSEGEISLKKYFPEIKMA